MTSRNPLSDLLDRLIAREGGYVDHPYDRGGPTKYGITQATLSNWRGYPCTEDDVRRLTKKDAKGIYHDQYWVQPKFHRLGKLSPILVEMLFDTGVHSGPTRAVKILQEAMSLKADGFIGPVTMEVAQNLSGPHLAALFMGQRTAYLGRLITRDPSQASFAHGWMNRMREFIVQIPLA